MNEKQFFDALVEKSGYMDPKQVRMVYYAMKDIVFDQLKVKGGIELPEFCDIYLSKAMPRKVQNRFMAVPVVKQSHHQVRILPKRSMRDYFKTIEAFYEGREFDPAVRAGLE